MSCTVYASERLYIDGASTLEDLITRLETVRDLLVTQMAKAAVASDTSEYRLNDGQTIINRKIRSMDEMSDSLTKIEKVIQIYANRYNGRVNVAKDYNDIRYLTGGCI